MGTRIVECRDCGAFAWEGSRVCPECGSTNLTIGFHSLLELMEAVKKEEQELENKGGKDAS